MDQAPQSGHITVTESPFARALFGSTRLAWLWLIVRLWLGFDWLQHGLEKAGNPAWTQTGLALKGFWTNAIKIPPPPARPPIAYDWYRSFIEALLDGGHYTWFAKLIVFSELAIGIALVLGVLVGITAFFGAFLNWNFMMAGTAATNPMLFTVSILLMLAWRTAGWWGADRWLLPLLGARWKPGRVFERAPTALTG
jgi:thiosulfate dehydrogenase [quinone] large subunit